MLRLLLVVAQIAVFAGIASYLSETDHIALSTELQSIHFARTVLASDLLQRTGAALEGPTIPFEVLSDWKDTPISCSLLAGSPNDLDGGVCDRAAALPQLGVFIQGDALVGVDRLFGTASMELRLPLDTKTYRSIGWIPIPVLLSFLLGSLLPTVILVSNTPSNNIARSAILGVSTIFLPIAALIAAIFVSYSLADQVKSEAIGDQMQETLRFITDLQSALSARNQGRNVPLEPSLSRLQSGLAIQEGQFVWGASVESWEARNTALSFGIPLIALLSLLSGLIAFFGESFEFKVSSSSRTVKLLFSLLIAFTCSVVAIGLGGAVLGATPYLTPFLSDVELQKQSIALTQTLQTGIVSSQLQSGNDTAFRQLSEIYSGLGATHNSVKVSIKSVLAECINFVVTNGGLLHTTKTAALFNGLAQIAQQLPQSSLGGTIQNISAGFSDLEMRFLMMVFQQNTTYFEKFAPGLVRSITEQLGIIDNVGSNDITAFDSGLSAFLSLAESIRTEVLQLTAAAATAKPAMPTKLIGSLEATLFLAGGKIPPLRMIMSSTAAALVNIYSVSGYCCVALLALSLVVLLGTGSAELAWISSNRRVLLLVCLLLAPLTVILTVHNTALTTTSDQRVVEQEAAQALVLSLQDVGTAANQCYRLWKASEASNETGLGEEATMCIKRYNDATQRLRSWTRKAEWPLPLTFSLGLDHFGQLLPQTGKAAAQQFIFRTEHVSQGEPYWSEQLIDQYVALDSAFAEWNSSCLGTSYEAITAMKRKLLLDALLRSNDSASAPLVFPAAGNCSVDAVEAAMSSFQVSLREVVGQPDLSLFSSSLGDALTTVVAEARRVERGIRSLHTETKAQRATFWAPVIGAWAAALVLQRVDLFSFHCDMLQRRR
jgi:hypothetical protein